MKKHRAVSLTRNIMRATAVIALSASLAFAQSPQIPPGEMTATAPCLDQQGVNDARNIKYTVDGSGMNYANNPPTHSNGDPTMWLSNNGLTFPLNFRVDLGAEYMLSGIKIYNFNLNGAGRGINAIEIYAAADTDDPQVSGPNAAGVGNSTVNHTNPAWTYILSTNIPQATLAATYTGFDRLDFAPVKAKWVLIRILSSHYSGQTGISELLFFAEWLKMTFGGVSEIGPYSASFNATLENTSGGNLDLFAAFAPETTGDLGETLAAWETGGGTVIKTSGALNGPVTVNVTGLAQGIAYVGRMFATNGVFTVFSAPFDFTTDADVPKVEPWAPIDVGGTNATARGQLVWVGTGQIAAEITMRWTEASEGDNPELWTGGAQSSPTSYPLSASFDYPISGLDYNTEYQYAFFVSNAVGWAWSDIMPFKTLKRDFHNKTTAGAWVWENADNWNDAQGQPAGDYPRLPGDRAFITGNPTINLGESVAVGEMHFLTAAVTINNAGGNGELVFENNDGAPALLRNVPLTTNPIINVPLEIINGLTVENQNNTSGGMCALMINGPITGPNTDITIAAGDGGLRFSPPVDTVHTNRISGGMFGKGGAKTLTLRGDNEFGCGTWRSATTYHGVNGGTLVIDGGTLALVDTGTSFLFSDPPFQQATSGIGPSLILTNACKVMSKGNVNLGIYYNGTPLGGFYNCTTLSASGSGTAWNFSAKNLSVPGNKNTIEVANGAVFTNIANIYLGENGSAGNMMRISNGGAVTASTDVVLGQLPGNRALNSVLNGISVDADAHLRGSRFILGTSLGAANTFFMSASTNSLTVRSGTASFGAESYIGHLTFGAATVDFAMCGNFVSVGGEDTTPGILDMGGANLRIGWINNKTGKSALFDGNYLEVSAHGEVRNVGALYVGDNTIAGNTFAGEIVSSNNFVRTSGGVIECRTMNVASRNGLSPVVRANGSPTGFINVSETATFAENTYVWPVAEKGAPAGKHLILKAETLTGAEANLRFAP
ncbi:MAG: hypothetical protein FWG05_04540, partial [Kiritimatiellaeota bacterium]|nr:hypothetical protein [Kiritimatiellota bacterium]